MNSSKHFESTKTPGTTAKWAVKLVSDLEGVFKDYQSTSPQSRSEIITIEITQGEKRALVEQNVTKLLALKSQVIPQKSLDQVTKLDQYIYDLIDRLTIHFNPNEPIVIRINELSTESESVKENYRQAIQYSLTGQV